MTEQKLGMKDIYHGLEQQHTYYAELEKKYKSLYEKAKTNRESLELSMEALSSVGDFTPIEEQNDKTEEEEVVEIEETNDNKKQLSWLHKNAKVVKIGKDGTKLGTYNNQSAFAKQIGKTQTTIANWMKQSKEIQLEKRNYYLMYEY
jgi:hypothetical protein